MNINIVLAGLREDNVDMVLQRMEAMVQGLPKGASFSLFYNGCEGCLEKVKGWAGRLNIQEKVKDDENTDIYLFCGTAEARMLGISLAAGKGLPCYTDALAFEFAADELQVVRKVYSTHAEALFPAEGSVVVVSQGGKKESYDACMDVTGITLHPWSGIREIRAIDGIEEKTKENTEPVLIREIPIEITDDLSRAKLVFLGGKGLGSRANFQRMEALAEKLGASAGCTRPVAMSGWTTYDKVVGISGSTLQADVCIAFGVSGAGPLMQGAEGAAYLVAINKDPKAPIFHYADDGVVEDCLKILEAMEMMVSEK